MKSRKNKNRYSKKKHYSKKNRYSKKRGGVGSSSERVNEKCKICCEEAKHKNSNKYHNVLPNKDCKYYYTTKTDNNSVKFYSLRKRKGSANGKSHCTENNSLFSKLEKCPSDKYSELYNKYLDKFKNKKTSNINFIRESSIEPPLLKRFSSNKSSSGIVTSTPNNINDLNDSGPTIMLPGKSRDLNLRPAAYY